MGATRRPPSPYQPTAHSSDQLAHEIVDGGAHVAKVPALVDASGLLLDVSAGGVVPRVGQIGRLGQRSKLDGPNGLFDGLVAVIVALALPEGLDDVFDADDALLAENLLDEDVVGDGEALAVFTLEVAPLADDVFERLLRRQAPATVVLDQQQLLQGVSAGPDEGTVVDLFEAKLFQNFLGLRRGIP